MITDAVTVYLAKHFGEVAVRERMPFDRDGHGVAFLIEADGVEYRLNILDDVVAGLDKNAVVELLGSNQVVSVMRDLVGFPVTLTASGCIFGDL